MRITERFSRETARDYALRMIKHNITTLDLAPGSMVSENELSEAMGLSRTPIREALIELAKIQIVEILPQRGSRIALVDYNLVEESRFLRLTLEKAIVELACAMADTLDFSIIDANLKLQAFYVENNVPEKLMEMDDEFHKELFRLTNKLRTYHLMNNMTLHFDRVRSMSLMTIKEIKIVNDHAAIVQAIRDKNALEAVAAVTKHLSRYQVDEQAIREKYPSYFYPNSVYKAPRPVPGIIQKQA